MDLPTLEWELWMVSEIIIYTPISVSESWPCIYVDVRCIIMYACAMYVTHKRRDETKEGWQVRNSATLTLAK